MARLRAAGCVYAEDEAGLLVAEAGSASDLERMVAARLSGAPLEQVLGWAEFCGLRIAVAPGVFVPRRRSGLLVREALRILRDEKHHSSATDGAFRHGLSRRVAVDLCCGTGAIGAAVLAATPEAEVWAADVNSVAVQCACGNLPEDRICQGDLYDALPADLRGRVDVLVANAPYVPTDEIALMPPEARDHEARIALDGGLDGIDIHRRIVAGARDWLAPGGHLLIETGRAQSALTASAFEQHGLPAQIVTDDDLDATVVVGTPSVGSRT